VVAAKVGDRLAVSNRAAQKFFMGRFNLKKLNDVEVKEENQVRVSNKFAAL
jgi:hypothetical protein